MAHKKANSKITIVLGGAHANALPIKSLEDSPNIDYLITGQAEKALCELINNEKTPENITGLYWRDAEGIIKGEGYSRSCTDLSELPYPAWHLFPKSKDYPIMIERGCPFSCVFCSHNMSHRIISRPVSHVMQEIEWLSENFSPKQLNFEDETFGINKRKTIDLLNELISFNSKRGIQLIAQTRVDVFTETYAKLMKKAGFKYVSMGIESGSQKVLDKSGKNITISQITNAVSIAKKTKLKTWLKFIIGLPGDTVKTVNDTISLATKLNADKFSAAIIVAYPGSAIYSWAKEGALGYKLLTTEWESFDKYLSPSVELDELPYSTMKKLQIKLFLSVYLYNFRFVELATLVLKNISIAFNFLISLLSMRQ